ncbi:hypothetical protein D3C75_679640 [compost metagenome]
MGISHVGKHFDQDGITERSGIILALSINSKCIASYRLYRSIEIKRNLALSNNHSAVKHFVVLVYNQQILIICKCCSIVQKQKVTFIIRLNDGRCRSFVCGDGGFIRHLKGIACLRIANGKLKFLSGLKREKRIIHKQEFAAFVNDRITNMEHLELGGFDNLI